MYTVFLADDEFKVINGLLKTIHWEELDAEVIGYAQDGIEAIEKINRLHPDIVIIDIRMPKKSGLEVMEAVASDYPCTFLVFSGYTEFEYAKKALQLKAVDYLIKPVNISDIEKAIKSAKERVDQLRNFKNPEHRKKQDWLSALLDGRGTNQEAPHFQAYFLIVLHLHSETASQLEQEITDSFSDFNAEECEFILVKNHKELVVFCGFYKKFQPPSYYRLSEKRLNTLLKKYPNTFYWGRSSVKQDLQQIETAYTEAADMAELCDFLGCQQTDDKTESLTDSPQNNEINVLTKAILYANSRQEAQKQITDFFDTAAASKQTPNQIRGLCLELYYSLKYHYQKEYPEILSSDSLNKDYFNHSSDLSNLETIKSKILAFYDEMNQKLQLHNSYFQQKFIHACMAYVEEHLQETITLGSVAEFVNMNPAYLSHAFKKATGNTLFDYITECRIKKAKHLLKTTYLKIFEIAKEVGYQDQRYFCQVFKKKVGMTAAEYRNNR